MGKDDLCIAKKKMKPPRHCRDYGQSAGSLTIIVRAKHRTFRDFLPAIRIYKETVMREITIEEKKMQQKDNAKK